MGRKKAPAGPRPAAKPRPDLVFDGLTITGKPSTGLVNAWRGLLDRALESGQDGLDRGAYPSHRGFIEGDMAIVRKARAGSIIVAMLSPEVRTACMNLAIFGQVPRIEAGAVKKATPRIAKDAVKLADTARARNAAGARTSITEDEIKNLKAFCHDKGWNPATLTPANKRTIATALDKSVRRIGDYLKIISEASS